MKKLKVAFCLNVAIFIFALLANLGDFFGFKLFGYFNGIETINYSMFKFFTNDSNILMGFISLIVAINIGQVIRGKRKELPTFCYVLSLIGTVGVTMTMLVTVFFIAPTAGEEWLSFFIYNSFFLHLVNPILSILNYTVFMKSSKVRFRNTFIGIIPMTLYAIFYIINGLSHAENNIVTKEYDWYGFLRMGTNTAVFIFTGIILLSYVISLVLWKINKY